MKAPSSPALAPLSTPDPAVARHIAGGQQAEPHLNHPELAVNSRYSQVQPFFPHQKQTFFVYHPI